MALIGKGVTIGSPTDIIAGLNNSFTASQNNNISWNSLVKRDLNKSFQSGNNISYDHLTPRQMGNDDLSSYNFSSITKQEFEIKIGDEASP